MAAFAASFFPPKARENACFVKACIIDQIYLVNLPFPCNNNCGSYIPSYAHVLHSEIDLQTFPSCSIDKSSGMILIPSWVTIEEGKEATGPALPTQAEMRISAVWTRGQELDRIIVCLQRHWVSDEVLSSPMFGTR